MAAKKAQPVPVATPDLFEPGHAPAVQSSLPVMGIDVAKASLRVCLLRPGALRSEEAAFPNSPEGFAALDRWLSGHGAPRTRAGLEATGSYSTAMLHHLHAAGHFVSLINPRWIKDYARSEGRRNKTDAADARVIARYVLTHAARAWQPRTPEQEALMALNRRREAVRRTLTAEKQRLEGSCAQVRSLIKATIAHCERQLQAIDKAVHTLLAKDAAMHRRYTLLESIPGVGRATAVTLLAELPELECFERVRDVAAGAGLTPALCESGTSVRGQARMNRQGNGRLRKALYMPAVVLMRSKKAHSLSAFRNRLQERGKKPMVIIGALMRKLFQTACGVLKHDQPFNPSLA